MIFKHIKSNEIASYNTIVKFKSGSSINFLDFTLILDGEYEQKNAKVHLSNLYRFKIIDNKEKKEQIIGWSSGTGDIAPTLFKVGDAEFYLELKISEALKCKLKADELVIIKR